MGDTRMETYYGFVSTSEDALALFEACRLGYKQRVPRRLSDAERAAIRSGSVFVWEENESGMKRWTDGRSWSPSRVQGCFLTYHEWEGRRRAQRHPSYHTLHGFNLSMLPSSMNIQGMPAQAIPMGIARYGHFTGGPTKAGSSQVQYGFPKENGMLKKALSIRTHDGKRLHIIAYYSKEDHAQRRLLTPTTDPNFPRLVVPPNLYPDMSPESMYGASHSIANASPSKDMEFAGNASADPQHIVYDDDGGGGGGSSSGSSSGRNSHGGDNGGGGSSRGGGLHSVPLPMDIDSESRQHQQPGMHNSPDTAHHQQYSTHPPPSHPPPQHLHLPSSRLHTHHSANAAAASTAADSTAAGLYKARVQSLVEEEYSDAPIPPGSAPASLMAVSQLSISRPAPEQLINGRHRHPHYPHHDRQVTSSTSSGTAVGTRPSSNSFSSGMHYHQQHHLAMGPSASTSSAPASTLRRSTASNLSSTNETNTPAIVSEATQSRMHNDSAAGGNSGSSRSGKYLGLGGPLGLSGSGNARRATPLRAATTAAVLSRNPYIPSSASSRMGPEDNPPSSPLPVDYGRAANSPQMVDGPANPRRMSLRSSPKMPLLLSPINPPPLGPGTEQPAGYAPNGHSINLAAIRGDVREGPRRLPSISASLRNDSPPEMSSTTCSPGGLGIIHPGISAARSTASSLLPSPLPTPRQSLSLGFDADRGSSPQRPYQDSLSLLASAADRAQVRHVSVSNRTSGVGHHPYSRALKRGPTMRSVSLKQSEDIRQLGVLDQSLKLK